MTGITGGSTYKFRVRAKNLYGWGAFSSETSIMASQQPDPVPSIDTANVDTKVIITWAAPMTNYADLLSYTLQVLNSNRKDYADANSYCDEDSANLLTDRKCSMTLTELRAAPFSLTYNQIVVARVKSENIYGVSDYSQPNILGATIRTEPQ